MKSEEGAALDVCIMIDHDFEQTLLTISCDVFETPLHVQIGNL